MSETKNMAETIRRAWQKFKYEFNYPESSENPAVRDYLRRKRDIVTRRNFFSPTKGDVDALYRLYLEVDDDSSIDYKEREALLTIIAYPAWFLVER